MLRKKFVPRYQGGGDTQEENRTQTALEKVLLIMEIRVPEKKKAQIRYRRQKGKTLLSFGKRAKSQGDCTAKKNWGDGANSLG